MTDIRFRQIFLFLLVAAISIAFVAIIRAFLLTILLAAIFTGLSYPVYQRFLRVFRGVCAGGDRDDSGVVMLVVGLCSRAWRVQRSAAGAEIVRPQLERIVQRPGEFDRRLRVVPGYRFIEPIARRFSSRPERSSAAPAASFSMRFQPRHARRRSLFSMS